MAAGSRNVMVELVPTKLARFDQPIKSVETWIWPFKPFDNCRLKVIPFVVIGSEFVKASYNMKVLLEITLKVLVVEKFPPKSRA